MRHPKVYIETVPSNRMDRDVYAYHCSRCGCIFTIRYGDYYEYCPKCEELASRMPRLIYKLLRWKRTREPRKDDTND